jgi:NitT/TauT family transport system permease protein
VEDRPVSEFTTRVVLGTVGVAIFLLAWEAVVRSGALNPTIVSSPTLITEAFAAQWQSGELVSDLGVTIGVFVLGFSLALVVGVALGIGMGMSRIVEYAIDPFIWFLYSSPLIALYPLIVVWLGYGTLTVIAVTFLLTVVSIVVNTMAGVQSVEPQLVRAVRAFGGGQHAVVTKVVLPSSVPLILAGVRIGLSRALLGVVLGEMFSSNAGLGFRISFFAARLRTADVYVELLILITIGIATDQICRLLEARLGAWRAS